MRRLCAGALGHCEQTVREEHAASVHGHRYTMSKQSWSIRLALRCGTPPRDATGRGGGGACAWSSWAKRQGLTLVHFPAQRQRLVWDMGYT